jgi:hypothetical protein
MNPQSQATQDSDCFWLYFGCKHDEASIYKLKPTSAKRSLNDKRAWRVQPLQYSPPVIKRERVGMREVRASRKAESLDPKAKGIKGQKRVA